MAKRARHKKDAQLIVRINKAERDAFVALCRDVHAFDTARLWKP